MCEFAVAVMIFLPIAIALHFVPQYQMKIDVHFVPMDDVGDE